MIYFNEYYVGDTLLKNAQNYLTKYRNKYLGKSNIIPKMHSDPDLIKFSREIENVFGFSVFSLVINEDKSINACTIPIGSRIGIGNVNKGFDINNKGIKFDKNDKYVCIVLINSGLIMSKNFSDREIMAIILHEIGHNFNANFLKHGTIYSIYSQLMNIASILLQPIILDPDVYSSYTIYSGLSTMGTKMYVDNIEDVKRNDRKTFNALVELNQITRSILTTVLETFQWIMIFTMPLYFLLRLIGSALANLIPAMDFGVGYRNEKLSDSFATIYGYGADASSAFLKFDGYVDKVTKDMKKNKIWSILAGYILLPYTAIAMAFDEHPPTAARIRDQIDYINNELETANLDPKLVKELKTQKKDIEQLLEKLYDPKHYHPGNEVYKKYTKWLYDKFGGDFRELFYKDYTSDKYDIKYKKYNTDKELL